MSRSSSPTAASSPPTVGRSEGKRAAILDAATEVFLKDGYLGASMDKVAARATVSKQTVYKHFGSKETLFVEIVGSMTTDASDTVHDEMPGLGDGDDVAAYLRSYAERQLLIVLTPRLMQLRRLVIGEVERFPELARVLYERGPKRAMAALEKVLGELLDRGLLSFDDRAAAAAQFNWLVMAGPLNQAMLLGDGAIPSEEELRRQAAEGVRVFLACYGSS